LLPVGALLLLVMGLLFPRSERLQRLRVSPGLWPGSEAIMLAHAQGRLSADEYQLIELPWSSAAMRALGNGAADVAVVTLDGVLRMREAGQELRVLMVLDESKGADVVLARLEVMDVRGLKGKRVGVDVRGVGVYVLINALESAGMTADDLKLVPMIQPEMEQALADKEVDAVVASEPWASRLRLADMHSIYDSRQLQVPVMRMVVASGDACRRFRPQLVALLKAQIDLTAAVRSGGDLPEMAMMLRRERLTQDAFRQALTLWKPFDISRNEILLSGEKPQLGVMAASAAEQMQRAGFLKELPSGDTWMDGTLLKEVKP
jgi:NitT/TauT family transport system substrate-binding protein